MELFLQLLEENWPYVLVGFMAFWGIEYLRGLGKKEAKKDD